MTSRKTTSAAIVQCSTSKETLIKATRPGFFVHEAATPKFASS